MNPFEDYSKKYTEFTSGQLSYPVMATLTLARLTFLVTVQKSIFNDLKENQNLTKEVLSEISAVVENDYFDFELVKDILSRSQNEMPPLLKKEIENVEECLKRNETTLSQFLP